MMSGDATGGSRLPNNLALSCDKPARRLPYRLVMEEPAPCYLQGGEEYSYKGGC